MSKGNILILGGRSDIGLAVAYHFAYKGYSIQLAARNCNNLKLKKSDIELRYNVNVSVHELDILDFDTHAAFIDNLPLLPDIIAPA